MVRVKNGRLNVPLGGWGGQRLIQAKTDPEKFRARLAPFPPFAAQMGPLAGRSRQIVRTVGFREGGRFQAPIFSSERRAESTLRC